MKGKLIFASSENSSTFALPKRITRREKFFGYRVNAKVKLSGKRINFLKEILPEERFGGMEKETLSLHPAREKRRC